MGCTNISKAVLVCNLLCIAAAADGYQYTLNGTLSSKSSHFPQLILTYGLAGNVIANQGFINHLGFRNEKGIYTLNAQYTALWGAMQSLGQLVGMVLLNPVSDRIGRKMTMYLLWIILAGVSRTEGHCAPHCSQTETLRDLTS